jgi:hypothetical protein
MTVGRGFTPVGAFKKRLEPQESNIRKSSRDMAARFRSCVEAPAIGSLRRPERGSYRRSNPDGTIISHSRAILAWVREQPEQESTLKRVA